MKKIYYLPAGTLLVIVIDDSRYYYIHFPTCLICRQLVNYLNLDILIEIKNQSIIDNIFKILSDTAIKFDGCCFKITEILNISIKSVDNLPITSYSDTSPLMRTELFDNWTKVGLLLKNIIKSINQ